MAIPQKSIHIKDNTSLMWRRCPGGLNAWVINGFKDFKTAMAGAH
jgi:hypothetical protein